MPDGGPGVPAIRETAYRRGYFQGAHAVWEAIAGGMTPEQIKSWLWHQLYHWRWHSPDWIAPDRAIVIPPPEPGEDYPLRRKEGKR